MLRKIDYSFKIMTVYLIAVDWSVVEVANELDIDSRLLSKWCRNPCINGIKILTGYPKISPEE